MSFRTRLTTFFVVIVVVPMAAVGFVVFRLIDDSQSGKAEARASGVAATAVSVYENASSQASLQARTIARELAFTPASQLPARAATLLTQTGLQRIAISVGSASAADVGNPQAVAPGVAIVTAAAGHPRREFEASEMTAAQYARAVAASGTEVVVRQDGATLAATLPAAARMTLPARGQVTVGSATYEVVTQSVIGFGGRRIRVSVMSDLSAPGESVGADRALAAAFIVGFLILAFFFSLLSSRALQGQLSRFLEAARRLAGGDFSSPVPTAGRDEFALLGDEFNNMSRELERRLAELQQERARVRQSIRRIGEAFASGLDRDALLELALETAMDATEADRGRVSSRQNAAEPLSENVHLGRLAGLEGPIYEAERQALTGEGVGKALTGEGVGKAATDDAHLAAVALGPISPGGPTYGVITVCRDGREFSDDDIDLLRSLAAQATLAISNVNLHYDIQRQAITDDLTGLATHGHFQELLGAEMEEVRRYQYPVGLIMLDLDDFKSINDTYGHQQGDLVLRRVADVLRETSRDVDILARYGGEEMALILPHTDLEGTYELAERIRAAIEALQISKLDGSGTLRITASLGAAASVDASKNDLIAAADGALYTAKREGKNRTVRAAGHAANVVGGE